MSIENTMKINMLIDKINKLETELVNEKTKTRTLITQTAKNTRRLNNLRRERTL